MTRLFSGNTFPDQSSLVSRGDNVQALLDAVASVAEHDNATSFQVPPTGQRWHQDASILLLGIRGTGKTSLALLAASCVGFRLVDADQHFYQETGVTRAVYASRHGFDDYRRHELNLMRSLLEHNPSRCIIVCGPGSAEGTGQELLKDFGKTHPVVYILRDPEEIDRYLRTNDPAKISRLSELASSSYRPLSNFEFYNLSEPLDPQHPAAATGVLQSHPSLILKNVEQDFLRLIQSIASQSSRPRVLEARHSLSFLPPESKPYTYALTIPLDSVTDLALQLRSTDLVVDAVEIVINSDTLVATGMTFDDQIATYITKQYYTLRRNVRLPVIFHVELPATDASLNSTSAEAHHVWGIYLAILYHGLRLAPEYLTLDMRCDATAAQGLIARKISTKVIAHYFDPAPEPGAWDSSARLQMLEKAAQWHCDLVRISQAATSQADNVAVQRFRYKTQNSDFSTLPVIAYNIGRSGLGSSFVNSVLTPVTNSIVDAGAESLQCSMLTVRQAQTALYASFTLDKLEFLIFGNAVTAALSPVMHNAAYDFCGMPHHYRTYQSTSLRDLEGIVSDPNFGGASISSPFKKEVLSILDYVSPEAQAIGAVNTLIPLRSRRLESLIDRNRAGPVAALFGDNTDWIGIHTCIRRNLSPVNAAKARKTALILGAGGMAQAAIYAAIRLGVQTIVIHNRTLANAKRLVEQFNGRSFSIHNINLARDSPSSSPRRSGTATPVNQRTGPVRVHAIPSMNDSWPSRVDPPTIIVSCIARVSEAGKPPARITVPEAWLTSPTGGVVIELAYNPPDTPLVQQIRALSSKGWIAVHGLQVLPEQGIAQFELFTGRKAPEHLMRAQVMPPERH